MEKQKKKVRVYGLDSTAAIRARLIEILEERVRYHKDKFVAKILLDEMQAMEVKKSGKVEHSQNTHDDQVFSYLMALYVWYDGQNLMENFRIQKSTLRTDEDIELEENAIEEVVEKKESVDIEGITYETSNPEIAQELEWLNKESKLVTTSVFREKENEELDILRRHILTRDPKARANYAMKTGLDENMLVDPEFSGTNTFVVLPENLFNSDVDDDQEKYSVLQGNLSGWWNKV